MKRHVKQKKIIQRIEAEYQEPIRDVLQGFADMGYSYCTVARILGIAPDTLKRINASCGVEFPRLRMPPMSQAQREQLSRIKLQGKRCDARRITYQGRTQHLSAWARETGINLSTLWNRLTRYGWSVEKAFTRPLHAKRPAGVKNAAGHSWRRP
jgi:DNA invertase Pin-like site-specific DNA recombinase